MTTNSYSWGTFAKNLLLTIVEFLSDLSLLVFGYDDDVFLIARRIRSFFYLKRDISFSSQTVNHENNNVSPRVT